MKLILVLILNVFVLQCVAQTDSIVLKVPLNTANKKPLIWADTADIYTYVRNNAGGSGGAGKLNVSDTGNMLSPYLRSNVASATYAPIASPTFTGTVNGITAAMVGLGNANNTSDASKPVSTATQTALDLKANLVSPSFTTPALGTPSSGNLANCTFPTLNQNTTGSAATLTTPRNINGVAFNGSADITVPSNITPSTSGNIMTSNGTLWTSAANNGGWTTLRVSGSAATNNTTSLADITGLVSATLSNSTKYEIEVVIDATVSAVTTGITYAIATGGTGGASVVNVLVTGTTTTNAGAFYTIAAAGAATTAFVTSSGANGTIVMKGFVTTRGSGTATISVQQAKPTSGTATAQVGSTFRYRLAQ